MQCWTIRASESDPAAACRQVRQQEDSGKRRGAARRSARPDLALVGSGSGTVRSWRSRPFDRQPLRDEDRDAGKGRCGHCAERAAVKEARRISRGVRVIVLRTRHRVRVRAHVNVVRVNARRAGLVRRTQCPRDRWAQSQSTHGQQSRPHERLQAISERGHVLIMASSAWVKPSGPPYEFFKKASNRSSARGAPPAFRSIPPPLGFGSVGTEV